MNMMYKERFPHATAEMESKLNEFLRQVLPEEEQQFGADPVARFVILQLAELCRDCLKKSEEKMLTSRYFSQMNENIEKLLLDVCHTDTPFLPVLP